MSDDGDHGARLEAHAGLHDVLDESPPAGAVQHFGEVRTQARPFARGKDHNDKIREGHVRGIVRPPVVFDNTTNRVVAAK
jgi:hypothetical protein